MTEPYYITIDEALEIVTKIWMKSGIKKSSKTDNFGNPIYQRLSHNAGVRLGCKKFRSGFVGF